MAGRLWRAPGARRPARCTGLARTLQTQFKSNEVSAMIENVIESPSHYSSRYLDIGVLPPVAVFRGSLE